MTKVCIDADVYLTGLRGGHPIPHLPAQHHEEIVPWRDDHAVITTNNKNKDKNKNKNKNMHESYASCHASHEAMALNDGMVVRTGWHQES